MLQFFGYAGCSTCRKAEKKLREFGRSFVAVDITQNPPSAAQLRKLIALGIPLKRLYNTSGEMYRRPEIRKKIETLNEDAQLELLAANGRLIRRPIVFGNAAASVGFNEEEFRRTWT